MTLLTRPNLLAQFSVDPSLAGMRIAVNKRDNGGEEIHDLVPDDIGSAYKLVRTAREIRETAARHKDRAESLVRAHNNSTTYLKAPSKAGKGVTVIYTKKGETTSANINITYRHDDGTDGLYSAVTKGMATTCPLENLPQSTIGDSHLHMHLAGLGLRGVLEYFLHLHQDTDNLQAVAVAFSGLVFSSGSFDDVLHDGLFVLDNQGIAHAFIAARSNFNPSISLPSALGIPATNIRVTSSPPNANSPVSRENQPLLEMFFSNLAGQLTIELLIRAHFNNDGLILRSELVNVWNYVVQLSGEEDD